MVIKFGRAINNPRHALAVEKAGFDSIWVADHFAPFSHEFGLMDPVNAVSWMALPTLPLILNNATRCTVGTFVLCPTFRYHPAIIAQYFAQLDYLFPGRTILGVGTGEAVNETPIVGRFPPYRERMERLREAIEVIRKLWTSRDYFDYQGKYYNLKNVFLYAKPKEKIPIIISAFGEKSAELAGKIGDGIIIHWTRPQQKRDLILKRFAEASTKAGKDPETMIKAAYFQGGITSDPLAVVRFSKASWSWARLSSIHEPDPRKVDEKAKTLSDEEVLKHLTLVPKADDLIGCFESALKAGINHIIMADFTPAFVSLNIAPPEAADWPKKFFNTSDRNTNRTGENRNLCQECYEYIRGLYSPTHKEAVCTASRRFYVEDIYTGLDRGSIYREQLFFDSCCFPDESAHFLDLVFLKSLYQGV